jgi:transposase
LLREVKGESYEKIAGQVLNLKRKHPCWTTVRTICNGFSSARGCKPYKYKKCGRTAWKLTPDVQTFILKRMLADRKHMIVTSTSLAAAVAEVKGIVLEASAIRKLLKKRGYKWLPRRQKPKYSKEERAVRVAFCRAALRLSKVDLRHKMAMSMDGVIFSIPPSKEAERINYCWGGVTHMWRKPGEANSPTLAGASNYVKQVPAARSIPLWGGISADGFAAVLWHQTKKTNAEEWATAVRSGCLTDAIRRLNPKRRSGPWTVLCDNEGFLRAPDARRAHAFKHVELWGVPPKSPDLNPIEMFWGWVRVQLRNMDLEDLRAKREPLGRTAYTSRVKVLLQKKKSQEVAMACAKKFRPTCQAVVNSGGAAAGN